MRTRKTKLPVGYRPPNIERREKKSGQKYGCLLIFVGLSMVSIVPFFFIWLSVFLTSYVTMFQSVCISMFLFGIVELLLLITILRWNSYSE